ncbi:hypothetical protein IE077_001341, partial [Cardiosporidium cionae]
MTSLPHVSSSNPNGEIEHSLVTEEKLAAVTLSRPLKRSADSALADTEESPNENSLSENASPQLEGKSSESSLENEAASSMQPQLKKQALGEAPENATLECVSSTNSTEVTEDISEMKEVVSTTEISKVATSNGTVDVAATPNEDSSLYAILRRQVEYYFSDDNMKYDKFFREHLENPSVAGFEGWLPMKIIMNCPRITKLNCTQEMVLTALETSSLCKQTDESGEYWLRRDAPLPALQERTNGLRSHSKKKKSISSYQAAGCLAKIVDLPEEIGSWIVVRDAIKESLPKGAVLKFISPVGPKGVCKMWFKPFPNAMEIISMMPVTLNGASLKLSLMEDEDEIRRFLHTELPGRVRREREKLLIRQRNQLMQQPLLLAGQTFNNVDHLKMCVSELLGKTEENTQLKVDSAADKVVRAILGYHPSFEYKKGGSHVEIIGIKVISAPEDYKKKGKKCFAMLKRSSPSMEIIE